MENAVHRNSMKYFRPIESYGVSTQSISMAIPLGRKHVKTPWRLSGIARTILHRITLEDNVFVVIPCNFMQYVFRLSGISMKNVFHRDS